MRMTTCSVKKLHLGLNPGFPPGRTRRKLLVCQSFVELEQASLKLGSLKPSIGEFVLLPVLVACNFDWRENGRNHEGNRPILT